MPDTTDDWLAACPERMRTALRQCAAAEIPPNVAVMRLLVEASEAAAVERILATAVERLKRQPERTAVPGRLRDALTLLRDNPQAFATVRSVIDGVEHSREGGPPQAAVAHWAAVFDRAARASPEGGVALYALGNPELLRDATAEVVASMRDWGLLGPDRALIEIGCGIGRFQEALAPEVRLCVGIDVSGEMIAQAKARCAGMPNARFVHCSGRDLAPFEDDGFDLVFGVDSFPYLVQAGLALARTHVREAARVLRRGGTLLILNFSYRGSPDEDRADVARLARDAGFEVVRHGTRPFSLWDGTAFQLRKAA